MREVNKCIDDNFKMGRGVVEEDLFSGGHDRSGGKRKVTYGPRSRYRSGGEFSSGNRTNLARFDGVIGCRKDWRSA